MRGEVYCSSESTNGNAVRTGEINGSAMPVRLILAVDNKVGDNTVYETNFFVQGATHVYLYTLDSKGTATPVTAWPGYAISTASTADKKFNFRYESKVNKTEDLYVIFNYKSSSGAIFSMSYNAEDIKKGKFTNITNPKDLIGFNLAGNSQSGKQNGLAPDYANYGNGTKAVANGVTWTFSFNVSDSYATASQGGIGEGAVVEPETKNYRIYFPDNSGKFWMWFTGTSTNLFTGSDNPSNAGWSKSGSYYYIDFSDKGNENKAISYTRFSNVNKDTGKTLSDFKEESIEGKTVYCAYIDTDDNFNKGNPSGSSDVAETRNFRIYWDRSNNNLYQIYLKRNDNGQIISSYGNYTGYDDSQTQKWWYYDFSITAKPSEFAKMSVYADFQGDGKKYQPLKNNGSINISEFEYNSSTSKYEYGKKDNALALSGLKQI